MSEHRQSGINRAFTWLKKTLQITEKTVAPDVLLTGVQPKIDVFGWERLSGLGPASIETVTGALITDVVVLSVVPEGVARFVIYASCSHNDPGGLALSFQVRGSGVDIAINADGFSAMPVQPMRVGLERNILLQPGEQLICRSNQAPAAGTSLFIRMKFVDLDPGEYLPPL